MYLYENDILEDVSSVEEAITMVQNDDQAYKRLPLCYREEPRVLNSALQKYVRSAEKRNPIIYAIGDAATYENLILAARKGTKNDFRYVCREIRNLSVQETQELVSIIPGIYEDLGDEQLNDPQILRAALGNYNQESREINPISHSLNGALTEDNINLAIKKGGIKLFSDRALIEHPYYVLWHLQNIKSAEELNEFLPMIPEELYGNKQIIEALKKQQAIILKSPMKKDNGSPVGTKKLYKYYQAVINILPNGDLDEQKIGTKELKHHGDGIYKSIEELIKKYPNLGKLKMLKQKIKGLTSGDMANKCSEYGIISIIIEGENAHVYFPETISFYQYVKLSEILINDMNLLTFDFMHKDNDYYREFVPETLKFRDLNYTDAFKIIENEGIFITDQKTSERQES